MNGERLTVKTYCGPSTRRPIFIELSGPTDHRCSRSVPDQPPHTNSWSFPSLPNSMHIESLGMSNVSAFPVVGIANRWPSDETSQIGRLYSRFSWACEDCRST